MTSGLGRRIAFTLGALLVYRIGCFVPLPGVDTTLWLRLGRTPSGDLAGVFYSAPLGTVRFGVFVLNLWPYVVAALTVQVVMVMAQRLRRNIAAGERGRRRVDRATLAFALLLAAWHGLGVALGLEDVDGLVPHPGATFRLAVVATVVGGTVFLIWLAGQITRRGIGNGIALILAASVLVQLPRGAAAVFEHAREGAVSSQVLLGLGVVILALVAAIAFVEVARYRVPVDYPERRLAERVIAPRRAFISLKLNSAGLIPVVVAGWFWDEVQHGARGFMLYLLVMIVVVGLVYTAILLDPEAAAERLAKHGGVIPGIEPGESTAAHLDHVWSRIAVVGTAYLAVVFLIPEFVISATRVPYYIDVASAMIVVCTILDIAAQVRSEAPITVGGKRS